MALQKQPVSINFSQGLDTKTDPFQVPPGKFLSLENSVFNKGGLLQKRNGYTRLSELPNTTSTYLTTFNGNLTAIGTNLEAYSASNAAWINKGNIQPVDLSTLSLIKNNTNQSYADTAIASNGLICTVYSDNVPSGGSTVVVYKYAVADKTTGQNIQPPSVITPAAGTIVGSPRVFVLGNNFLILASILISGVNYLKYFRISIAQPYVPGNSIIYPYDLGPEVTITNKYTPASTVAFDAVVAGGALFITWNGNDNAVHVTSLLSNLGQTNTIIFTGYQATMMSICADTTGVSPVIYGSFYDSGTQNGYVYAVSPTLSTVFAPVQFISSESVANIASAAQNGLVSLFYEVNNNYGYDAGIPSHYIKTRTASALGVLGSASTLIRSVGLASKAFIVAAEIYFLTVYYSQYQPTYFLIDSLGNVTAKLAYSNAGPYLTTGLPSVTVLGTVGSVAYLYKDQIAAVNKTQGDANPAGIYAQTGISLASFDINSNINASAEIGKDLYLTGGFLWMYDGYTPVEHLFHVWPDNVEASWSATGGSIHAQPDGSTNTNAYFYQVTYEWSDNQGNIFRSAPSIPLAVTTTGSGTSGSITLNIPTLRLTAKISNPVKIVIYRWSVANQTYYQTTSVTVPLLNDTTVDYVTYIDTLADASILGNNIVYTTGGVIENIAAPAIKSLTLFDTRLWYINGEDQNLLGFSKQVIESVPVETSDLFTLYVSPTSAAQGPTGPVTALSPLDDKLIIWKKNAIYYINGTGPDNTGANNQYSQPIFITATVGCDNQKSIVFMPQGLMFQSDKGIWLLGRDLNTTYIGAPVEEFTNGALVQSSVNVPGTNQVRFTLDTGITLMYDYYYGQWGTFTNIPAISSTLYEDLHTFVNSSGQVYQENLNSYLDGSNPVLMSFKTSWFALAGLQGFERFYQMFLLGKYYTPFKLEVLLSYDYQDGPSQGVIVTPEGASNIYGSDPIYGDGTPYGGPTNIFEARVFPQKQKCESFQVTIKEIYDPQYGIVSGAGLTLSGINLLIGAKKGARTSAANRNFG